MSICSTAASAPREGSAQIERRALRINDAATAYGVGRSTLYKLMAAGKLETVKILGRRLIVRDSMEALLREGA